MKKKKNMTLTNKLGKISGLKIQNNEKENISLTFSMQFDTFIARGQGQQRRKQKFSFFATAPRGRKKEYQNLKAREMQATRNNTSPKLTLHLLSANSHKKNRIIIC